MQSAWQKLFLKQHQKIIVTRFHRELYLFDGTLGVKKSPFIEWNQPFWFKIEPNSSQDYTKVDQRSAFPYVGGETSGLDRLNHYLWKSHAVATYKQTRNGLIGVDYSTKFSPWLALGCLSPRKIFWEIKKYEEHEVSNQSTYWVIFELIWRDYFKFVCQKYGDSVFYLTGKLLYLTKSHCAKVQKYIRSKYVVLIM